MAILHLYLWAFREFDRLWTQSRPTNIMTFNQFLSDVYTDHFERKIKECLDEFFSAWCEVSYNLSYVKNQKYRRTWVLNGGLPLIDWTPLSGCDRLVVKDTLLRFRSACAWLLKSRASPEKNGPCLHRWQQSTPLVRVSKCSWDLRTQFDSESWRAIGYFNSYSCPQSHLKAQQVSCCLSRHTSLRTIISKKLAPIQ